MSSRPPTPTSPNWDTPDARGPRAVAGEVLCNRSDGSAEPSDDRTTTLPGAFDTPSGLALDGEGNVIVADTGANAIRKISPAGSVTTVADYDIPTAAFGEISAQDDARERAAETMAERFRAELALRMAARRTAAASTATTR